jgi:hypothetical protein
MQDERTFWQQVVADIDRAEARAFELFGIDKRRALNGSQPMIAPLLLFAIAFAVLVASYVIQSMLVKRQKQKPASLEDWDFPQSTDGTPQAVVFGDGWLTGPMVILYGNYRTFKIKSKSKK